MEKVICKDMKRYNAARHGMIGQNPAHGAKQPKLPQTEMRIHDQNEVTQFLICVIGNRNEALYHLAVKTRMRIGELLGLMWFDLEWNSGYLRILRQAQRVPGEGIKLVDPKTRAGKRTIPLGRTMLQILSEHKRKQQLEKAVVGDRWKENNLVFPSSIGTPQSESNFLKIFKALLQKAGLPIIRFHNLRHTAASIMLNNGRNFIEVSKMLGHSQPSTTMNTYAHLIPVIHNDIGDFMDELLTPIPIEMGETTNQTTEVTG